MKLVSQTEDNSGTHRRWLTKQYEQDSHKFQGEFQYWNDTKYFIEFLLSGDDTVREEDRVLSKKEEPVAAAVLGNNRETSVKCFKWIGECSSKKATVDCPPEVPLYQCTQYG